MPYYLFSQRPRFTSEDDQNANGMVTIGWLPEGETRNGLNGIDMLQDDSGPCSLPFDTAFALILASTSLQMYDKLEQPCLVDINTTITRYRHLISRRCNNNKIKSEWCQTLAKLYRERFQKHSQSVDDLEKSIEHYHQSIDLIHLDSDPSSKQHVLLSSLAWVYLECSAARHFQDIFRIEKAISLFEEAIGALPSGHEQPLNYLHGLAIALYIRFEYRGFVADLNKSISILRQANCLCPPDHSLRRNLSYALGFFLLRRFHWLDNLADAEESTLLLRNIGNSEAGVPELEHFSPALSALSLRHRFRHLNHFQDLDQAVSTLAEALVFPGSDVRAELVSLCSLADVLRERFSKFRDPKDRKAAVMALEKAIELCRLDDTPPTPALSNLARVYLYDFSDELDDINKAISLYRQALDLTPEGHWEKYPRWCDLGVALNARFKGFGRRKDFDESHLCHQRAADNLPDGHQCRPMILRYLGNSWYTRFDLTSEKHDIDRAIQTLHEALEVAAEDYPERVFYLCDLGRCLGVRFFRYNDIEDAERAIPAFREAAMSSRGPLWARLAASSKWGRMIYVRTRKAAVQRRDRMSYVAREDIDEADRAFSRMMELVSQIAWLGDTISTRHHNLRYISNDIRFAATTISTGFGLPDKALEWLEQGRSVVWRQQLNLRTLVDDLQTVKPELADRLRAVSASLDSASTRKHLASSPHIETLEAAASEKVAPSHRRLADEWDNLMQQVRLVPGFERFLLPKVLAELRAAARIGPIVLLNMEDGGPCIALVLQEVQENVLVVPCNIRSQKVDALRHDMSGVLASSDVRSRLVLQFSFPGQSQKIEGILSSLWSGIVKPVLDALNLPVVNSDTESYPRIIWCPTGPLTFLPIHAAGDYAQAEPGHRLSDYAVSSYTSTISTLLDALGRDTQEFSGLLAVTQSSTPGLPPLPHTPDEAARIQDSIGRWTMKTLQDEAAIVDAVREGMERSSWIHLACHAIQDPNDPLKSGFCLQDGRLELGDIIQKSHPQADFAFLSACQTSAGDAELADEAVHLAAGMQLAGYRRVIATMWSIRDEDGPLIAEEVYAELFKGDRPDSSRAAHALHRAVLKLQEQTRPSDLDDSWFLRWIPFIHMGL